MILIRYILNNIFRFAIEYTAKIIDFHCADATAAFHTRNGSTTNMILIYERIC